jgi:DNA-binding Lrp family transcriptional regulator
MPILPPPTNITFFIAEFLSRGSDELSAFWAGKETAKRRKLRYHPANRRSFRRIAGSAQMRDTDARLLALLKANAREPTASLARKLGLARSTVQERIARLEREGAIKGYTVRLSDEAESRRLRAIVMITADPKQADRVSGELKRIADVRALSAVSGAYDMIAIVEADTTARMDAVLDRIGKATGVARTVSSIILSEKFSR